MVATDHRSVDGTTEILERYEREGVLHLIREQGEDFDSQALRTRMARLAADEFAADWVIGTDCDEFWWPRGSSLKEVLSAVRPQLGVVEAPWRFFLPLSDGPPFFAERMTTRLSPSADLAHPHSQFKPSVKVAHRADSKVVVQGGSHRLLSGGLVRLAGWHPIEVLHFPIRSVDQLERKMEHWASAGRAWRFDQTGIADAAAWFATLAMGEELVDAGVESGALTDDTRLRDALRAIRSTAAADHPRPGDERQFLLPAEGVALEFPRPPIEDERAYRSELVALSQRSLHRLQRRLDDLGARVAARE